MQVRGKAAVTHSESHTTRAQWSARKVIVMWRRALSLLKYIGLPIPLFLKSKFNFSRTVCEMVFVSFEVEKMRMFLVVHWSCVLLRSRGAVVSFPV